MKLTSKEICPITVRDRLIKNLAGQDVNVCDLVKAVEWAENECFELDKELAHATKKISELKKENEELEQYVAYAKNVICELNSDIKGYQEIVNTKEVQAIINEQR